MSWYSIMSALHAFLVADDLLIGYAIKFGAVVGVADPKTALLIRGPFSPRTNDPKSRPSLTVFVECWEQGDETDEPEVAYSLLADFETRLFDAVKRFAAGDQRIEGKPIRVQISEAQPDGDVFRPSVASRTRLTITWL